MPLQNNRENQFIDFRLINHEEGKTTLFPSSSAA
jgi:hypothetical protein